MGLLDRLMGQSERTKSTPVSFAVLDVETTGLSPRDDRIVEIALVRLAPNGAPIDEWSTRLDPEGPVGATHIHGITQDDVNGKPLFRSLAPELAMMLGGLPVVAHNAAFDLGFLSNEFERAGWDMPTIASFCTLGGSHDYFPSLDRRRLADCCWAAGVQQQDAHSALGDARATAALFAQYLARDPQLATRITSKAGASWPSGPSRSHVTWEARPGNARPTWHGTPRRISPPLVKQLSTLTLSEVVEEGAPIGSLAYLETLLTALEDGELSATESQQLAALSYAYNLTESDIATIHQAFTLALAHRALDDGHVSRDERAELHKLASLIGVAENEVVAVIAHADSSRSNRMSAGLRALPQDWPHGEPLRVGDKVVFTGCDEAQRMHLERKAESLGVRVIGNVSRQVVMLVTDGEFKGVKAAKAAELSTRVVHPDVFEVLLDHLQPALPAPPAVTTIDRMLPDRATHARGDASPSASTQSGSRGASPSIVRAWAIANGIEVGTRGRLHADVFDAFWLAHPANE